MPKKILLLGIVTVAIIISVGFFIGNFLSKPKASDSKNPIQSPFQNLTRDNNTPPPSPAYTVDDFVYIISPPSTGVVIKTKPISLGDVQNNKSVVMIPRDETKDIEISQNVILYDTHKNILFDVIGKVTSMMDEGDFKKTTITFYTANPNSINKITHGDIVLNPDRAPRLPLSALVMNSDGAKFYWEIDDDSNAASRVTKKSATITYQDNIFFVPVIEYKSSRLFVLNPNDKLRDGAIIKTSKNLYQAPPQTIDKTIQKQVQYLIEQENSRIREEAAMIEDGGLTQDPTVAAAGGCPAPIPMSEAPSVNDDTTTPKIITPLACGADEDLKLPLLEKP